MRRLANVTVRSGNHTAAMPAQRRPLMRLRGQRARRLAAAGAAFVFVVVPMAWFALSGTAGRLATRLERQALFFSAEAGLRVDDILVSGRAKTPRDELFSALGVNRGDAILAIDLPAARKRIEAISWVRSATVERRLPNEIDLVITERAPVALWQSRGRYFLIDHDGQMVGDQIDDYAGLPLMVGDGAPDHVASLVDLLATEPELQKRFKTAQWVGERRWNITLNHAPLEAAADHAPVPEDIEVRLPEDEPQRAWHELAQLDQEQKLLERQIGLVDMRLPDRLVLRVSPPAVPAKVAVHETAGHETAGSTAAVKLVNARKPG